MRLIGLTLALGLLLAACGGGDDSDSARVLELGRRDITVAEFRTDIRTTFLKTAGTETFCNRLAGLSDREVADVLVQVNREKGLKRLQEPNPDDEEHAASIVKQECARIQ